MTKVASEFDKYVIRNGRLVSKTHPSFQPKYRVLWHRVALLAFCILGTLYFAVHFVIA